MPSPRRTRIPYGAVPRGMCLEVAAWYVGLKEGPFKREVSLGNIPKSTWLTNGQKVWLREGLDAYLDRKAGIKQDTVSNDQWLERLDGDHAR